MFDEMIKGTWDRAGTSDPPLSRASIERLLRPAARRTGRALEFLAASYVAMLAVAAVLAAVNLYGYRGNPAMLAVEGGVLTLSAIFAAFGVRIYAELRRIGRADLPLAEAVECRLDFYERRIEPWLLMAAATPWLLSFAINSLIDNEHGTYRINHPVEFGLVSAAMLVGTYAALRLSMIPTVREMRALLHDLHAEVIDETRGVEAIRRRSRAWTAVAVVVLSLGVLVGILKWLGAI
jgi:hypothetical protein